LVEWSYERLSGSRRELLGAFTVFDGDVDPSAIESVVDTDGDASDALTELVRTGLLTTVDTETGTRYRTPDLVRRIVTRRFAGTASVRKSRPRRPLWSARPVPGAGAPNHRPSGLRPVRRVEGQVAPGLRRGLPRGPRRRGELRRQI